MTKERMIEALEELRSYIDKEAMDVLNVNIQRVHVEALKQGIEELKRETVSRETYEWEYNIKKDLDNENAALKKRCKELENILEETERKLKENDATSKIEIESDDLPITVANKIICAKMTYEPSQTMQALAKGIFGTECNNTTNMFTVEEIKEIADHLYTCYYATINEIQDAKVKNDK